MKNTTALFIATSGLLVASSDAAVLVDWDFTGLTNPTSGDVVDYTTSNDAEAATYATTVAKVTAGDIAAGSNGNYPGRPLSWSSGTPDPGELNLQYWDLTGTTGGSGQTGGTGDGTADSWLQFSLTADSGFQMNISRIDMSAWRNGAGAPEDYKWDYSTDGGATWNQFGSTFTEANAGDSTFRDSNYTDTLSATSVLFRFAPTGGSGNIHINGFSVTGDVSTVPEPGSAALLGLGGLAMMLRRRK